MVKRRTGVVWILGAGFSRPLGGPLLRELFTKASRDAMLLRYPKEDYDKLHHTTAVAAHWLYHSGRDFFQGPLRGNERASGRALWNDAEQYLDMLDATSSEEKGSLRRRLLERRLGAAFPELLANSTIEKVASAARRLMAAECSGFIHDSNPNEERWQPHIDWARSVTPNHTIISFNYDLILEQMLSDKHLAKTGRIPFHIMLPGAEDDETCCPVLKLHGSVNWRRATIAGSTKFIQAADDFALTCSDSELAIASPGPNKLNVARELRSLWAQAEQAIKDATAVVFLGYRFPPTDAEARKRLLRAVTDNPGHYLAAHVVLGPSASDDQRVLKLLQYSLQSGGRKVAPSGVWPDRNAPKKWYNVVPQPLYCEDFFTVMNEGKITQPWAAEL